MHQVSYPDTIDAIVYSGNVAQVARDSRGVAYVLSVFAKAVNVIKLIDRNVNSPEEIEEFHSLGIRVLSRRILESYLYDEEVLNERARSVNQDEMSVYRELKTDISGVEEKTTYQATKELHSTMSKTKGWNGI